MSSEVIPIIFTCQSDELLGFIHKPDQPSEIGVLVVVGGPQYRVGSHRQFILLAQSLANENITSMRFDVRGMGDSAGKRRTFNELDDDINSAINSFFHHCPYLTGVVIWGLCDAASAALFYAHQDKRIKGLVLLNPWAYTEQGAAKTLIKHYYLERFFSFDLWKKIIFLKFDYRNSFISIVNIISKIGGHSTLESKPVKDEDIKVDTNLSLPDRMRECLSVFHRPVLFILSGRDLTAEEFKSVVKNDEKWNNLFLNKNISKLELSDSDHTFSSAKWRSQVENLTINWIKQLNSQTT